MYDVVRPARYLLLDTFRGAACLLVLLYHCTLFTYHWNTDEDASFAKSVIAVLARCWLGVPIFFVISGYCIASAVEPLRNQSQTLGTYFIRRIRRIYPPYLVVLGVTLLVVLGLKACGLGSALFGPWQTVTPIFDPTIMNAYQWFGNITLSEQWRPLVFGRTSEPAIFLGHSWTLGYEEQFYLIAGMLAVFTTRRFYTAIAVVSLLVIGAMFFWFQHNSTPFGTFMDGRWLLFAMGILSYWTVNYATTRRNRIVCQLLLMVSALAITLDPTDLWHQLPTEDPPRAKDIVVGSLFALALILLRKWDAKLFHKDWLQPLNWFGRISYSVYLVHYPICLLLGSTIYRMGYRSSYETLTMTIPICLTLSTILGWCLYSTVERWTLVKNKKT